MWRQVDARWQANATRWVAELAARRVELDAAVDEELARKRRDHYKAHDETTEANLERVINGRATLLRRMKGMLEAVHLPHGPGQLALSQSKSCGAKQKDSSRCACLRRDWQSPVVRGISPVPTHASTWSKSYISCFYMPCPYRHAQGGR